MKLSRLIAIAFAMLIVGLIAVAQSNNPDTIAVVSAVAPLYPSIARSANATGDVTTKVEINRDGKVTSVQSTGGHPLFRKTADEAARRWLFSPSTTDKKRTVTLTFSFRLVESDAPA